MRELSDEEVFGPRGIRNNNPLNLKATVNWTGMAGTDGPFAVFDSPEAGLAAADRNLQTYATKHGINTVSGAISRWAPPNADGNNTNAYIQHVSTRLGVDPAAPFDLNDPGNRQSLLAAMAEFENGQPVAMPAATELSDEEVFGGQPEWQEVARTAGGGVTMEVERPATAAAPLLRPDDALGFQKGALTPLDNGASGLEWLASTIGLDKPINALGEALGLPSSQEVAAERERALAAAAADGRRPGGLGEFVGNVVGTLPLGALKGGAIVQGAASGALLTDAKDSAGVIRDALIGGVAGKVADEGLKLVGRGAQAVLGKAPKVMDLPALEAAKKAAYKAVDDAGFSFPKADVKAMVDDFAKTVRGQALSKGAKEDAESIIGYARQLTKGDLPLTQLEKLRGDIYEAMVKKGGDTGKVGQQFRDKIDKMIDGVDSDLVRKARDLNARWNKARTVDRASKSADIRAEKDYGGDYGRKLKDRLFPLVDPANPNKNLRGASPEELAAIERIVRGTKGQNAASTVGGMLDPRRMGGKILAGITTTGGGAGAPLSGGLSLLIPAAQMGLGFGLTGAASKTARQNMDELMRLIAVGGSKEALKKQATPASRAAGKAVEKVRPAAGLIGASAASRARAGSSANREKRPTRSR